MSIVSNNSSKLSNKIGLDQINVTNSKEITFNVGDKVFIASNHEKTGTVMYNGVTKFSDGIWIGVALDIPIGKHNGSVQGVAYFNCEDKHGIFVRQNNLRHLKDKITNLKDDIEEANQNLQINNNNLQTQADCDKFIIPDSQVYIKSKLLLGEKVSVIRKSSASTQKSGILRFLGQTKFSEGIWAGIELDNPIGKNDGSIDGVRYFSCKPQYGLFALENKVQKYNSSNVKAIKNNTRIEGSSKFGSNESISSFASNFSSASRTRVRLGITAIGTNGKLKSEGKIRSNNSLTGFKEQNQGTNAFQKVLKEKEQHVEQLIREREIERMDLATATSRIDELERQLSRQVSNNADRSLRFENRIIELQQNIVSINEEKDKLTEKLEEEKKKIEDLLFQIEEKNIDRSDLEIKIQENEHNIAELKQKLVQETNLKKNSEKSLSEFLEINRQTVFNTDVEKLESQVSNLQKELLEEKQNSRTILEKLELQVSQLQEELLENKYGPEIKSMSRIIEDKDNLLKDIQIRYENLLSNFEENLKDLSAQENSNNNADKKIITDRYENEISNLKMEIQKFKITELNNKETITKINSINESYTEELSKARLEIVDLIKKIDSVNSEYENQIEIHQSMIQEKEKLNSDLSMYSQQLEDLKLQLLKSNHENKDLTEKIEERIEINFKQESESTKARIELLERENQFLKVKLDCSEEKYNSNIKSMTELIKKNFDFEQEIEKINVVMKLDKDNNIILHAENESLHHELELMKQNQIGIKGLEQEIEDLQLIISNSEKEKISFVENCEINNKKLSIANDQSLNLSKELQKLQESFENIKKEYFCEKQQLIDKVNQLEKQLEEVNKKNEVSVPYYRDQYDDKIDLLNESNINSEKQINFLHMVIANREEKVKSLEVENERLRESIKDLEIRIPPMKIKKILPPRLYCDICEIFDSHDTKQCPVPIDDSPPPSPIIKIRIAPRLYCDICEEFDLHNTSECQDEQTY